METAAGTVSIEEFRKLSFKIGVITEVTDHPDADKLYVVKVDMGGRVKQLVAGIKRSYTPESLVGKQVVVVDNMAPALLRGVESQGMILAASDENGIFVVTPDKPVTPGSVVK